ncbi:MAG: septum formation initiator family protein [Nitrospirota bacterium]|nr:septum formation initiator family protein [Nitrospirota bacterium]
MARRNYVRTPRSLKRTAGRKKLVIAAAVVAGIALLWSLVMGEMGLVKYLRMKNQENALRVEIDHLTQDNRRLLQEVKALKYDAAYLERLARDKIGLARPGEIVYYYGDVEVR